MARKKKPPAAKKAKKKPPAAKKAKKKPPAAKEKAKKKPPAAVGLAAVRAGGTEVRVDGEGAEVWLYDDDHLEQVRTPRGQDTGFGGLPPDLEAKTGEGLVVGYSMQGDGAIHLGVLVGEPLTEEELSAARWLEPQVAFLRLPSGALRVESNSLSRIGPERYAPQGGPSVPVAAGDYRLTLYRVDDEALDREGLEWPGPREVAVLTPGGTTDDAAEGLLPFEERRDLAWVGKYEVEGRRATALVWFDDTWDTFTLNLDAAAIEALGLEPGGYFRTHVPDAGLTLLSVFAASWEDGRRLPPPAGQALDEYGYAAPVNRSDWDGAQTLFAKRDAARTAVADRHRTTWIRAEVEVVDLAPRDRTGPAPGPAKLEERTFFDDGFLTMVLSEVLPGVDDLEALPLPAALKRIDAQLKKLGLRPLGDRAWEQRRGAQAWEVCVRLYAGLPDALGVVWASEGVFDVFFLSELEDGTFVMTGSCDDLERFIKRAGPDGLFVDNPRVRFETRDEPLPELFAAHRAALRTAKAKPAKAPAAIDAAVTALERFRAAAFD